jgi:hypothetical protein
VIIRNFKSAPTCVRTSISDLNGVYFHYAVPQRARERERERLQSQWAEDRVHTEREQQRLCVASSRTGCASRENRAGQEARPHARLRKAQYIAVLWVACSQVPSISRAGGTQWATPDALTLWHQPFALCSPLHIRMCGYRPDVGFAQCSLQLLRLCSADKRDVIKPAGGGGNVHAQEDQIWESQNRISARLRTACSMQTIGWEIGPGRFA